MRVCGIIAEYDPFHNGHLYHLTRAKEETGADYMVCVLGCAFSQRGDPMLFQTFDRAEMALRNGFDLVLGMPVSFSCAQANRFARGGVGVLAALGAVTHLSFGCETDKQKWLHLAAHMLANPDEAYKKALKDGLARGKSFARAQGEALRDALPDIPPVLLTSPNFILGISYLQELFRLKSAIIPVPVKRENPYHSKELNALASASAVRTALLRGDWQAAARAVPGASLELIMNAAREERMHKPEALDRALIAMLLKENGRALLPSPEVSEGLELRVRATARQASSRAELAALVKTKRYPYARINRALSHALMEVSAYPASPSYARLLGLRRRAAPLLRAISGARFPLVDKPARSDCLGLDDDMHAEELWALGAGLPVSSAWQARIRVVD